MAGFQFQLQSEWCNPVNRRPCSSLHHGVEPAAGAISDPCTSAGRTSPHVIRVQNIPVALPDGGREGTGWSEAAARDLVSFSTRLLGLGRGSEHCWHAAAATELIMTMMMMDNGAPIRRTCQISAGRLANSQSASQNMRRRTSKPVEDEHPAAHHPS